MGFTLNKIYIKCVLHVLDSFPLITTLLLANLASTCLLTLCFQTIQLRQRQTLKLMRSKLWGARCVLEFKKKYY